MSGVPIRFLIGLVVLLIAGALVADAQKVVPAEEIRKEIYLGEPVFYQDVLIVGDLYLYQGPVFFENKSGGYFYIVNRIPPIFIINSTIQGSVDFSDKVFNNTINFGRTRIMGTANFENSKFYGDTYFAGTYFNGSGSGPFEHLGSGIFWDSYFGKEADFSESKFNGTANFWNAIFDGVANFEAVKFDAKGLDQGANFWNTTFRKGADFTWSEFNGRAFFWRAKFDGIATFGATFNGDAVFDNVQFNEDANFIGSKFNGGASFTWARFIKSAMFYGVTFNRTLDLTFATFTDLKIDWTEIKNKLSCDGPVYLALIRNFRALDQPDGADDCYYQYRYWRQGQESWSDGSKYLDILALISCGYGVRFQHTIFFGIFWLILFGFVYFLMIGRSGLTKASFMQRLKESLWFSAIVLLSVPSELYPQKIDKYNEFANQIKYHLPIIERLIGWGILILFINTLSRVMIRY